MANENRVKRRPINVVGPCINGGTRNYYLGERVTTIGKNGKVVDEREYDERGRERPLTKQIEFRYTTCGLEVIRHAVKQVEVVE